MEYFLLYSIIMGWILRASRSQQFYNPMETSTTIKDEHRYTTTTSATNTSSSGTTIPSSNSMRTLLDRSSQGNFDPMTYEDYYDSIPYYDILDYFYIEEDIDNNITSTAATRNSTSDSKSMFQSTPLLNSSTLSPANHDVNVKSFSISPTKSGMISTAACDVVTHLGCDVTKFERCDSVTQTCRCIGGYLKSTIQTDGVGSCTAAKFFHGDISIPMPNTKVNTLSTQAVRIVQDKLWDYVKYSMKKHNTHNILLALDMRTSGTRSTENPSVLVLTYQIALQRDAPSAVTRQLRTILQKELQKSPTSHGPPKELTKIIGRMTSGNSSFHHTDVFTPLIELNPCSSREHTYCAANAHCLVENGSQICGCLPGLMDMSPDPLKFPGEICEEQCQCENEGICVANLDDYTIKECSCIKWFFGSRCQVNGKDLLIISITCITCVVVILTMVCCCCHARVRHRNRHTESSLFRFTPDTSILKLPRLWMEAHYSDSDTADKDVSPQSIRRMSLATECNPYFDGYILEDIPASCLQSDRSMDIHSPHHEATIGTIRGAATISSHSIFRHY